MYPWAVSVLPSCVPKPPVQNAPGGTPEAPSPGRHKPPIKLFGAIGNDGNEPGDSRQPRGIVSRVHFSFAYRTSKPSALCLGSGHVLSVPCSFQTLHSWFWPRLHQGAFVWGTVKLEAPCSLSREKKKGEPNNPCLRVFW